MFRGGDIFAAGSKGWVRASANRQKAFIRDFGQFGLGRARRMNRGQKVQNHDCPAEERHHGSVGDRVTDYWVSGSVSPQEALLHQPPPTPFFQVVIEHWLWAPCLIHQTLTDNLYLYLKVALEKT